MVNITYLSCLIIVWCDVLVIFGADYEKQLVERLLKDYNPLIRPTANHTIPTVLDVQFEPTQIILVDDKSQSMTTYLWLTMVWHDASLTWNPDDYYGLNQTHISSDKIWKPDILLSNPSDSAMPLYSQTVILSVSSEGIVTWYQENLFVTGCEINVKNFPYDQQHCSIMLESQSYFVDSIIFNNGTIALDLYQNNTEWELISITSDVLSLCCPTYERVRFVMHIKRKPLFVFFNMMLPCFFTVAVALLAFLIPASSGEKMSIGITTLLSSSVLLLVISSELPRCSDYVPLIGVFYLVATGIIALICLTSAFILNLHHYGEYGKEVPLILQKIFFNLFGQIILYPRRISFKELKKRNEKNDAMKKFNWILFPKLYGSRETKYESEKNEIIKLQWTVLADIFDRLFLYCFSIGAVTSLWTIIGNRA